MAAGEDGGLVYGGWAPLGSELEEPSVALLDYPTAQGPTKPGFDFPHEGNEISENWEHRPAILWPSNSLVDRQEGAFDPFSLQVSPRDVALGSIILSLLVTVVVGEFRSSFLVCGNELST